MSFSTNWIDVAMTATIRPEILDLTLSSFSKNLLAEFGRTRLIVNVDPLGDKLLKADDVLRVCRRHFSEVVYRCPEKASFPQAVKWCWEQVETEFFLHLEDDWLLKKRISIDNIRARFDQNEQLASIRFNLTRNPDSDPPLSDGFSLNPSIMRKAFIDQALAFFDYSQDPEKQFRHMAGQKKEALSHWSYAYYGNSHESAYVIDTGKKWRRLHNYAKWDKNTNITWEENTGVFPLRYYHLVKYWFFIKYWGFLSRRKKLENI